MSFGQIEDVKTELEGLRADLAELRELLWTLKTQVDFLFWTKLWDKGEA